MYIISNAFKQKLLTLIIVSVVDHFFSKFLLNNIQYTNIKAESFSSNKNYKNVTRLKTNKLELLLKSIPVSKYNTRLEFPKKI